MYKKSGLSASMHEKTFKTYQSIDEDSETRTIKLEAMKAAEEGTNLILSGKAGTGKTHLAASIAIRDETRTAGDIPSSEYAVGRDSECNSGQRRL